ncbi:ubiquinone biosynthesis methyltransferase UbiE, partial [Streptomyces sp. NPDC058855]
MSLLTDADLAGAFDHAAPTYDRMTSASPGYHRHLLRSARRLGLPREGAGQTVLDLGCGTGASTAALLRAAHRPRDPRRKTDRDAEPARRRGGSAVKALCWEGV